MKFLRFSGLYALFLYLMNGAYLLNVLSVKETFEMIRQGKTIIRFGDGELRLLMEVGEAGFQKRNPGLEKDLKEIFSSYCSGKEKRLLLCMPGALSRSPREYKMTKEVSFWWFTFVLKYFENLKNLFFSCKRNIFGEAYITRPYYAVQNVDFAKFVFEEFKDVFKGKRLLIIEGRLTRFGVGNDLLIGAKSVRRILGPEIDAYDRVAMSCLNAQKSKSAILF